MDPFSSEGQSLVSKVQCTGNLKRDISKAVSAIGGLPRAVTPSETILVKPNFNTTAPPPATSDPLFVSAIAELLYEQGVGSVVAGGSSMTGTIHLLIRPDLIVVDGRRCSISGGPSGGLVREPNLVLASGDRIAIDMEGLKVIGSYLGSAINEDPWRLPMIRRAVELGLGAKSEEDYQALEA